jgi:hypothetical protein
MPRCQDFSCVHDRLRRVQAGEGGRRVKRAKTLISGSFLIALERRRQGGAGQPPPPRSRGRFAAVAIAVPITRVAEPAAGA